MPVQPSIAKTPPEPLARFELSETKLGTPVLRVEGEVDLACAAELEAYLEQAARGGGPVIVEMGECTFIDSTGIVTLLRAARSRAEAVGAPLAIAGPVGQVERVLRLTGVAPILPLFESTAAAAKALESDDSGR